MDFRRTDDIEEALASLAELGSDAQVLAGGTDVMIQIQRGELDPGTLVHIERVDSIGEITENGRLTVGALATHLELRGVARDPKGMVFTSPTDRF